MHKSLFQWGAVAALLAVLVATPAKAQENSDVRPVAEALGQRAAAADPADRLLVEVLAAGLEWDARPELLAQLLGGEFRQIAFDRVDVHGEQVTA